MYFGYVLQNIRQRAKYREKRANARNYTSLEDTGRTDWLKRLQKKTQADEKNLGTQIPKWTAGQPSLSREQEGAKGYAGS